MNSLITPLGSSNRYTSASEAIFFGLGAQDLAYAYDYGTNHLCGDERILTVPNPWTKATRGGLMSSQQLNRASLALAFCIPALALLQDARGQKLNRTPAKGHWEFTKVIDEATPVPGGTGTFAEFWPPSFDGESVAFSSKGTGGEGGIYKARPGSVDVVADKGTPIPGTPPGVLFTNFGVYPSIDQGQVAFTGTTKNFPLGGIYLGSGESLGIVVDVNTPIPGGSGNNFWFGWTSEPILEGGQVAFKGGHSIYGDPGIYLWDGTSVNIVANRNTPVPGGAGNFTDFQWHNKPALDRGRVAFIGYDSSTFNGVYLSDGGNLGLIANSSTEIPAKPGADFSNFLHVSLDSRQVAFVGADWPIAPNGVYTNFGGSLNKVADDATEMPGFGVGMKSFSVSADRGNIGFVGYWWDNMGAYFDGLFVQSAGRLLPIIATGDTLDGKTVHQLMSTSEALRGNKIAFRATFADNADYAIYIARYVRD